MKDLHRRLLCLSSPKNRIEGDIIRLGIIVPEIKEELKKNISFIGKSKKEILIYWDDVWKRSSYFEGMSSALYYYQNKKLSKFEFLKITTWMDRCFHWIHSDNLSHIFADIVEDHSEWVLPIFKKWSKSKNLWKRRQSVVGLMEYSKKRSQVLPFVDLMNFIIPLLDDKEYYVQKGLGWALREVYNIYPEEILDFFKKNILIISPIAYTAAIEKINPILKKKFNEERRSNRKKR